METGDNNHSRAALVVAHPSHELRVHGWLQTSRPYVYVFTDGSGRASESRLQSTTKVLADVGARRGSVYGRARDVEVYEAFLKRDYPFFINIAEELAAEFERNKIEYVVGDAAEGYSPTHDACRLLTNAAVEMVKRRNQRDIANFDFAVVGSPDECPAATEKAAIWVRLEEAMFARKIDAARAYNSKLALDIEAALRGELFKGIARFSQPQLVGDVDKDLSGQVTAALHAYPDHEKVKNVFAGVELDRFRTECLRPVSAPAADEPGPAKVPFYELYGEKMVAAGHYQKTIRYTDHFRPLAEAVWRHVSGQ